MKIELSKKIKLRKLEFVGEVDFFEVSPYIELLKDISTKTELMDTLESKGLKSSAIRNIIKKLEELGVLEDGDIVNIEEGFPEREYGKYALEIYENNTKLPFSYKNKEIGRESAKSKNISDSIKNDRNLIDKACKKSKNFSDSKEFQVRDIEANAYHEIDRNNDDLKIIFSENKWQYRLDKKAFEMKNINFYDLFEGKWNEQESALEVEFQDIESNKGFLTSFEASLTNKIELEDYGILNGKFKNIPIMPKTQSDALEWLLYLLKQEIEKMNRYISKDELHWLWNNILDAKPQLNYFDLEFDFEKVLNKFGRGSKHYWLLQATIDLFPFDTGLTPKDRVIIDANENINLENDFVHKFNVAMPKELIIVDRWIVDLKQFKGLEKIIHAFGNPKVTIITQEIKDINQNNRSEIEAIIERNNIKKIEKQKNEIVHSRYWIFDNQKFYKTNNSLDVIKVEEEHIGIKEQTTFDLYDKKDLEPELIKLLERNNV